MFHVFDYDLLRVTTFMRRYLPALKVCEGAVAIGLPRDGVLVAGVLFDNFNGPNIWMHVAAVPGRRWLVRDYLKACFLYPFAVCGVERLWGYVNASNLEARRFDEHLGFRPQAELRGAAADGGDLIVYMMRREWCRYLGA